MSSSVKTDDVIFNFFKQICDEKDDQKCVELGKEWIKAMETNLSEMEKTLMELIILSIKMIFKVIETILIA